VRHDGADAGTPRDWRSLSVLLIGCGSIGKRHARVLTGLGVERMSAYDPNAGQLASLIGGSPQVSPVTSLEEGLAARPDVVFILTPPKLHLPQSIQALRAGCSVFCEKPLSDSTAGVAELDALVEGTGLTFMVGLCFRYHAGVLDARKLLEAGRIGRLVSVRALLGEHMPDMRPDYRSLFSAKYSGAFDCMHDIDLALWFAGQPVRAVHSVYGSYSDIGIEAPDVVEILLDFPDRCVGSVHLDFFQRPRRRNLELIGTDGVITLEFASWDEYTLSHYSASDGIWERTTAPTRRDDMFAEEDRAFLMAVAGGPAVSCTVAEALRSIEVVEMAQALPETRRPL
jgi:predicted dehydrogenase